MVWTKAWECLTRALAAAWSLQWFPAMEELSRSSSGHNGLAVLLPEIDLA